ncbi:MAG TPA: F0F1 ATP synthase subunit A [Gaiellaceae bacterium]
MKFKAIITALVALMLVAPATASATDFNPSDEFKLKDWVPIHLGGLDLSINKAVLYLLVGAAVTCLLGVGLMRLRIGVKPGRRQTVGELIYDIAQTQVAETGLPSKAIALWFPYVATLMLFIFVINLISFLPLPFTGQTYHHVPVWGIYAATSQISVTLILAFMTFMFTHIEGIRFNGVIKYFRSWIPNDLPKAILPLIVPIEVLSQFMRLISLSVRLYANMLAGHILILTMIGLMFIIHSWPYRAFGLPAAFIFYVFEVVIVVTIQAFIFAALSAIYIGSAIEPEH